MMKFSVAVGLMLTMCSALGAQGKIVASENDVVSVGHVVDQVAVDSRVLFSQVQDKLVIVQCDDSVGTGFVCEMDGRRYFVTNKHVVQGQDRIVAVFGNGTKLKFGKLEIAQGVDLVRFAVATNQPALKLCDAEPEMNQAIFVFGNSDGGGVFTDLPGRILGVGPDQIEISSEIVHGNSGSAVLDEKGRVVGVATSATRVNNPADWVKKDTRFKEVRRYALRLKNINWKQISLKKFYKKYREAEEKRQREIGIYPQVRASFKTPSMHVNKYQTYGALRA